MVRQKESPWDLVFAGPEIDPSDLARTLCLQAGAPSWQLDYRTRLLIRDSLDALRDYWGEARMETWLANANNRKALQEIWAEEFEKPGFTLIRRRLMDKTEPTAIRGLFAAVGKQVRESVQLNVGGSTALILPGYLARHTEDIDVVDEVPGPVRTQHALLEDCKQRFGLLLTHFGSHYLPEGWQRRLQYFDSFGDLKVYLVNVYDIFVGKLFSRRVKDLEDLRLLVPQLDKEIIVQRFKESTAALQKDPRLLPLAQASWSTLFGEALPQ